jgi:hypothetical protein
MLTQGTNMGAQLVGPHSHAAAAGGDAVATSVRRLWVQLHLLTWGIELAQQVLQNVVGRDHA